MKWVKVITLWLLMYAICVCVITYNTGSLLTGLQAGLAAGIIKTLAAWLHEWAWQKYGGVSCRSGSTSSPGASSTASR